MQYNYAINFGMATILVALGGLPPLFPPSPSPFPPAFDDVVLSKCRASECVCAFLCTTAFTTASPPATWKGDCNQFPTAFSPQRPLRLHCFQGPPCAHCTVCCAPHFSSLKGGLTHVYTDAEGLCCSCRCFCCSEDKSQLQERE